MSGYSDRDSTRNDFPGPGTACLQKPSPPTLLARKVRETLGPIEDQ